jgi:cytochrome c5
MGLAWPAIVVVCALPISLVAQIGPPQQNARSMSSVWDGVYTAAQAERGKQVYVGHCARCHGDDLANSRNPLSGDRFAEHWESRTLADLFHRIRDTMPPGEASTVGETDKLDAVAYLLKQNGFPEGRAELTSDGDTLATIQNPRCKTRSGRAVSNRRSSSWSAAIQLGVPRQRKDMLAGAGHVVRPHGSIWWDRGGTALSPGGLRRVHLGPMVLMRCLSKSSPVHNGPTVSPDF